MKKFYIIGKNKLKGEINISGSKNSILSILAVSILCEKEIIIKNVPNISDVIISIKILKHLGSNINFLNSICYIKNDSLKRYCIPNNLSNLIRSSILFVPPILVRFKKCITSIPGGCNFCYRPIDIHLEIFKKFNIFYNIDNDIITFKLLKNINNNINIFIRKKSVGVTINIISLSIFLYNLKITIENYSKEPEVIDTINFLNNIGSNIFFDNKKIVIIGVKRLHGGVYKIIPDRIETGTFLIAASSISNSELICLNTNYKLLEKLLFILRKIGNYIKIGNDYIYIKSNTNFSVSIETNPYPEFPTDLQPQLTVLNCISNNCISIIKDNIFNRFSHVSELQKMGANIRFLSKNTIICKGVKNLYGKYVYANDLRSSASLIIAGISSLGQTIVIDKNNYIDRGYEDFLKKLKSINVNIIESNN